MTGVQTCALPILLNEAFVAKAPPQVVEAERKKIEVSRQHLARLMESIAALE